MRPRRQALLAASLWGLAFCAYAQSAPPSGEEIEGDEVPPPISLPAPDVPETPDTLDRRLAYAQGLAESKDGDCAQRLEAVQAQTALVAASPIADIVLPASRARLANITYRLHLGRAYCGGQPKNPLRDELLAALDAAQNAVSLYRAGYDYQSMAVMQYDVAVTYRLLGDQEKAVAALEGALDMDREYGFAADAAENGEMLRRWTGQAPPSAAPVRSITLKFAWALREAEVAVTADYLTMVDATVVHSGAATLLKRKIQADGGDWILSSEVEDRRYTFGDLAQKASPSLKRAVVLSAAERMWPPDVRIASSGEFRRLVDADRTAAALAGDIDTLGGDPPSDEILDAATILGHNLQALAVPDGLEAMAAEDYALGTSSWIDATLDQGVWYDMTAPLFMSGLMATVDYDIQFGYSHPVPCSNGAAEGICAEILVHATPNQEALDVFLRKVRLSLSLRLRYVSGIDLRLVVDPNSLLTYASEARRHWYVAADGKGEPLIGSETVISTYTYH